VFLNDGAGVGEVWDAWVLRIMAGGGGGGGGVGGGGGGKDGAVCFGRCGARSGAGCSGKQKQGCTQAGPKARVRRVIR